MAQRDKKGKFVTGHVPWHKGKKTYTNCNYCNSKIRTFHSKITKFCNHSCAMKFRWKDKDKSINKNFISHGYKLKRINSKNIREHHLVWMQHNNFPWIPKGCVIHHINCDKLDNRPENLVLLPNDYHTYLHHKLGHISRGGKNRK